jgi:hypothetical protein
LLQTLTELSVLDQLYIVSFSIFYGVMLHTLKGIRAFDTSAAFTGKPAPLARFAMSIAFLNLLPFLEFSIIILYALENLQLNILSILLVFGLSIGIFGFDKIFHALLIGAKTRLYNGGELESVCGLNDALARKFSSHYLQFLVPGLLYIFVPIGLLLLLTFDIFTGIMIIISTILSSVLLWIQWRRHLSIAVRNDIEVTESNKPQRQPT